MKSNKIAECKHITHSELIMRLTLRQYLEYKKADKAVRIYEKEKAEGKLKELKGSLANLWITGFDK